MKFKPLIRASPHHAITVERMMLALPRAHPLVKRKRLRLLDRGDEPFVWFPRTANRHVYDRVLSACHSAGVTLKIVQEVNSDTTMLNLVAGGIGLTFVIASAKKTRPKCVVLRDVGDLHVTAQLFAIWRKDNNVRHRRLRPGVAQQPAVAQRQPAEPARGSANELIAPAPPKP